MYKELEKLKQELLGSYPQLDIEVAESPGGFDLIAVRNAGQTCAELHYVWKDKRFLVHTWEEKRTFLGGKKRKMTTSKPYADLAQAKTLLFARIRELIK